MAALTLAQQFALAQNLTLNPYQAASAARAVENTVDLPPVQCFITVYDNFYKQQGEIGDYISCTADFTRNSLDTATIVIKASDPIANAVMQCVSTVVPITIQIGSLRWSGRVDNFDYSMVKGVRSITLQCMGDFGWFDRILCWPNFALPIQAQWPSEAVFVGPAISCIKALIKEQCFRLQSGLWEFINNALSFNFDWTSWSATMLESDGNVADMLMTPIVVIPTDPSYDTSPWVAFNGRMDKISTLVKDVVKQNGLVLTANLWLPGDPQPVGLSHTLTLPTIVVDVKDKSGITGPYGTFVDGFITTAVDILHGTMGDVLTPFLNPTNEYAPQGVNIAPAFGVNFVQPWVLFQDHPRSGITEFHLYGHHPVCHTVIGGGKSPQWVDDLISASFEWLIDSITIAIGVTGFPSDLFDATFTDTLLAFQMIENADRRRALGPYAWPEHFVQTGASAYTLDEWFSLMGAMWDTRGYNAVELSFQNGFPYTLGEDIFVGSLASFAINGMLFTEYVEKVTFADDRKSRASIKCVIGDGKKHLNPVVKVQQTLTNLQEAFQVITLSN